MVGHLTLAYPSVSFVLQHNGREQLRVDANGEAFNTLVAVLGRETARQMLPITSGNESAGNESAGNESAGNESQNIQVTGFVGRPQLTRANRGGQLFFVNGRLVRSASLQHALRAAYEGLLRERERHPLGVVFLQVAPGAVDVNVHPNKSEVRFVSEGEVHHALRVAVRDTLISAQLAPSLEVGANAPVANAPVANAPVANAPVANASPPGGSRNIAPSTPPVREPRDASPKASSLVVRDFAAELPRPTPPALVPSAEERQQFAQHLKDVRSGARRSEETLPAPQRDEPQPLPQVTPLSEPAPMSEPRPKLKQATVKLHRVFPSCYEKRASSLVIQFRRVPR